jgi:hypothetical protein
VHITKLSKPKLLCSIFLCLVKLIRPRQRWFETQLSKAHTSLSLSHFEYYSQKPFVFGLIFSSFSCKVRPKAVFLQFVKWTTLLGIPLQRNFNSTSEKKPRKRHYLMVFVCIALLLC